MRDNYLFEHKQATTTIPNREKGTGCSRLAYLNVKMKTSRFFVGSGAKSM